MSHLLLRSDARRIPLASGSVHCVVTSPPYYALRDYGVPGQLGLEETPEGYVAAMVGVFREVWRVLRDDGTLFLNLGDSYFGSSQTGGMNSKEGSTKRRGRMFKMRPTSIGSFGHNIKPKDLIGIPWMVAFALRADGWYLRSDIIWSKLNPMPESVTDRPTKSHEYIFLLAKMDRYFYDADAISEPLIGKPHAPGNKKLDASRKDHDSMTKVWGASGKRNRRSVWSVPSKPWRGAHFATFPPKLIEPCIKAGSPVGGIVFDPFNGSGTAGVVATGLGRRYIGADLSREYLAMAARRISRPHATIRVASDAIDMPLFATPSPPPSPPAPGGAPAAGSTGCSAPSSS
jgi:DNA modification methylase